ncbi:MAG: hypothetical protein U0350_44350 [Caldilineaceae bacterium]
MKAWPSPACASLTCPSGYSSPATFQAGAANTINLNFPAQPIENYIAHYFKIQSFIWDSHFVGTPVQTVDKLIADFNKTPSVGYAGLAPTT